MVNISRELQRLKGQFFAKMIILLLLILVPIAAWTVTGQYCYCTECPINNYKPCDQICAGLQHNMTSKFTGPFYGISSVPVPTADIHCWFHADNFTDDILHLRTAGVGEIERALVHWKTPSGMESYPLKTGYLNQTIALTNYRGNLSIELLIPAAPLDLSYFYFQ